MRRLLGKSAAHIWFDEPYDQDDVTANRVSRKTEKKRRTFLRSLAKCMSQLEDVSFANIGLIDCTNALDSGDAPVATVL